MRTQSDKKKKENNPVKDVVNTVGNNADKFPEISDEMRHIMPEFMGLEPEEITGAFEIVPGMTVEEMTTMFFDANALIEPPYKVWQLNSKGHRYYYRYDENGNPEFYPSVTTILSQTLPKSPFLIQWIADKGMDEAERYKQERAAYGTFMHGAFEELIIARSYDLDGLKGKLKTYIESERLPGDFINYADDLKKDVLAFAQFIIDYDVRPFAVEIALVHPFYKYAGMIDCPCTMLDRPGGKNRIRAIVDFKSGRKGFYEEAEIQLHLYREMWNANFEQHQIEKCFNFSPKDWRKKPSYNLKDQTDSPNAKKIPALLELAAIEDGKRDNIFTAVNGLINLDQTPDLSANIISLTLSELIKTKAPKDKTPNSAGINADDLKKEPKKAGRKKADKTPAKTTGKAATVKKETKRPIAPAKSEAPAKSPAKPKTEEKKKLLNDQMDM